MAGAKLWQRTPKHAFGYVLSHLIMFPFVEMFFFNFFLKKLFATVFGARKETARKLKFERVDEF